MQRQLLGTFKSEEPLHTCRLRVQYLVTVVHGGDGGHSAGLVDHSLSPFYSPIPNLPGNGPG